MKCHSREQINLFFKKTKFKHLKSIYFNFKTTIKQMLVFFQTKLVKSLILQRFSGM